MKIRYVAFDGRKFDEEEQRQEYEHMLYMARIRTRGEMNESYQFMMGDKSIIKLPPASAKDYDNQFNDAVGDSVFVCVLNDVSEYVISYIKEYVDAILPITAGYYRYSYDMAKWINLADDISSLVENWGIPLDEMASILNNLKNGGKL